MKYANNRRKRLLVASLTPLAYLRDRRTYTHSLLVFKMARNAALTCLLPWIAALGVFASAQSSIGTGCDTQNITCPACAGAKITDNSEQVYQVSCGQFFVAETELHQIGQSSPTHCLQACDKVTGCGAASFSNNEGCVLAVGSGVGALPVPEYIGLFALRSVTASLPSSLPHSSSSHHSTTTSARRTLSAGHSTSSSHRASPSPQASASTCSLSDIQCPSCDLSTISDKFNEQYRILCGSILSSTSNFALAEPLTPEYCLAQCDERSACVGAFITESRCTLALGEVVGRLQDPDFTAFVPLRPNNNSDGVITSRSSLATSSVHASTKPTIVTALSPTTSLHLSPSAFPTGAFTIESVRSALSESLAEIATLPAPSSQKPSSVSGAVVATSVDTFSFTPPAPYPTLPSPSPTPAPTVLCPGSNNQAYTLGPSSRLFDIQCNVGMAGSTVAVTSASDFAACAAFCTQDCGVVQFASTECELIASASVISGYPGRTVGVAITYPVVMPSAIPT